MDRYTYSGPPGMLTAHPLQWRCVLSRGTGQHQYTLHPSE